MIDNTKPHIDIEQLRNELLQQDGKYSVNMRCSNCGHSGKAEFTKGKRAPDVVCCPRCNCCTYSR